MGETGDMNINLVTLNNAQTLNKPNTVSQQLPFKMKPLCKDQVCFTSKVQKNDEKSFIGLFGPPKVNKKVLKELVSIMTNDPVFQQPLIARYPHSDFPVMEVRKVDNEIKIKMGFENSRGFYHKVDATVDIKTAKLSYKSVDGLEYKESNIKYNVNELFEGIIYYYKNRL